MGKPTGFVEFDRLDPPVRPVDERTGDYRDVHLMLDDAPLRNQAARCMDCGVPFCQSACPLGNVIPDWNDLVYQGDWKGAYERLRATNNFPEFTGRLCPAPCESACVLGIVGDAVTIEQIEKAIAEKAFEEGWISPNPPARRTGRRVAVVGSGPAGLACADQLNQAGHSITVFERHDRIGGLLRYGIPDFKLEKWVLDRRLDIMEAEGIIFSTGVEVGVDHSVERLLEYDAVVLCGGSTAPRDLPLPGRELGGIHFAWDYLAQQNDRVAGEIVNVSAIDASGKHVVVIGGGDTGSDCVGTANRQGAQSVTQFELLERPPGQRPQHQPWPYMPMILRTTTSHQEGVDRHWSILTKRFNGEDGVVTSIQTVDIQWDGRSFSEVDGTAKNWPADLVVLAIGYVGPEKEGLVGMLGLELDQRGNVKTDNYGTSRQKVFAAGDMRRGQSLIVWAISEGREAARAVDVYLEGSSELPTNGPGQLPERR